MLLGQRYRGIWQFGPLLEAAKGDEGGNGNGSDDSDLDAIEGLGDKGKEAIRKERQARRAADAKVAELTTSLSGVQKSLEALEADKAKREGEAAAAAEKDREAKGEFEALAKTRETERDQAKADLKALQEKYDALNTAAQTVVKSDFDSLPEEIRDVYSGAADDPVAMLAFIPKGKTLAAKLPGGEENNSRNVEGAKPDPPKGGDTRAQRTDEDKAAADQFARSYM